MYYQVRKRVANKSEIIKDIEYLVSSNCSYWHIGITDDPAIIKTAVNNPRFWNQWRTRSYKEAQNIKEYFVHKGFLPCKRPNGDSEKISPAFVYIY